jgi:hypothetical protein
MRLAAIFAPRNALRWLLVMSLAAAGPVSVGQAQASTTVSVTGVTLSTNAVTVAGLDVASNVTVTARLVSAEPIVSGPGACGRGPDSPFVWLQGPRFGAWRAPLVLTAGSSTDGTWTAMVPVTAAWDGDWHVVVIDAEPGGGTCDTLTFDWQSAPNDPAYALHVTGTNAAQLTVAQIPNPAPWSATQVSVGGRVALADGSPVAGKMVHACADSECGGGSWVRTTRADGTFPPVTVPLGNFIYYWVDDSTLLWQSDPNSAQYVLTQSFTPVASVRLTAGPNVKRLSLGRYLDISGSIGQVPLTCNTLRVQRYSAGRWHNVPATARVGQPVQRTVGTAHVLLTDYRFHFRTVARGNVRYRVVFPAQSSSCGAPGAYAAAVSATLIVGVA